MSVIKDFIIRAQEYCEEDGFEWEELDDFFQKEYYAYAKYMKTQEEMQAQSKAMETSNVKPIKPSA